MSTPQKFTLKIALGNDAMQTNGDIADALRSVARAFDRYSSDEVVEEGHIIRDYNGNTVGNWAIS